MQRYFVEADNWNSELKNVFITGDDVHHISRVMRYEKEDQIVCIHPDQTIAVCEIVNINPDRIECSILSIEKNQYELPVHVSIVQALPKGDKLELITQKGTELGAAAFYLYQAERSIVKWNKQKASKRMVRLNKIIKEAAEQSYREVIPTLNEPARLTDLIKATEDYSVKLIAYEEEAKKDTSQNSYSKEIQKLNANEKIVIFIGPEGGFTSSEVEKLMTAGFKPVKLGNRILRTETAALYALSSISYQFE